MAGKKVFVSYSHQQGDWVLDRLVPSLEAGGADVLIDRTRFTAGKAVVAQMDGTQEQAQVHVLVLSDAYLRSKYCRHEMDRAVASDPDFQHGIVIPVRLDDCKLPQKIAKALCLDLCDDRHQHQWSLLLRACEADLGTDAPSWLDARDEIRRFLQRNESVNLVVQGDGIAWRPLVRGLAHGQDATTTVDGLVVVNLEAPATFSCRGLVKTIIEVLGGRAGQLVEHEELAELSHFLAKRGRSRVALTHFDLISARSYYGVDLFAALRHCIMEERTLVLLIQSRTVVSSLMPPDHPLSKLELKTVELRARP